MRTSRHAGRLLFPRLRTRCFGGYQMRRKEAARTQGHRGRGPVEFAPLRQPLDRPLSAATGSPKGGQPPARGHPPSPPRPPRPNPKLPRRLSDATLRCRIASHRCPSTTRRLPIRAPPVASTPAPHCTAPDAALTPPAARSTHAPHRRAWLWLVSGSSRLAAVGSSHSHPSPRRCRPHRPRRLIK